MPKISVIMPVYNAGKYLRQAIDSIVSQVFTDWELIVLNDGSTDDSKAIIESYTDWRIKHFENEKNLGLIETLNKGIDLCRGCYIARMDADDVSLPQRFVEQVDFLDKNSDYAICGTNAYIINGDGTEIGKILNLETDEYLQINLLFSVPFIHPSMMIRAEVLNSNRFDLNYKHAEDYDLWCRIAQNHKVANISDLMLKYRWHTSNMSVLHPKIQEDVKDKIICRELNKLELEPTESELFLHKVSFKQKNAKEREVKRKFSDYNALTEWFSKIIEANKKYRRYDTDALISYLWSRWIVLCFSQKQFGKIFKSQFVKINPAIISRTFKLISFYNKK